MGRGAVIRPRAIDWHLFVPAWRPSQLVGKVCVCVCVCVFVFVSVCVGVLFWCSLAEAAIDISNLQLIQSWAVAWRI